MTLSRTNFFALFLFLLVPLLLRCGSGLNPISNSAGEITYKVYAFGSMNTYNGTSALGIVRVHTDGSVDSGFQLGTGPVARTINDVLSHPNGFLLLVGNFTTFNGGAHGRAIALKTDGSIETSISMGTGFGRNTMAVALDPLQPTRYYATGFHGAFNGNTFANRATRFNSDGSIDSSFDVGTGFTIGLGLPVVNDVAAAQDSSGKHYFVGNFSTFNGTIAQRIVRLDAAGTLDAGFVFGSGFNNAATDLHVSSQDGGDIYVAGQFNSYQGVSSPKLVRLNTDGSIDAGFAVGTGFESFTRDILRTDDGLYVVGIFQTYQSTNVNRIVRLKSDGSIDSGFSIGTGFDDDVNAIEVSPATGKLYVVGNFLTYNGLGAPRIARLETDGTIDSTFDPGTGAEATILGITLIED